MTDGHAKEVAILREARRLLVEKGWTRNEFARDAEGCPSSYRGPDAVCFCARGAILRAGDVPDCEDYAPGERFLERALPNGPYYGSIVSFNDSPFTTKEDVLALYDRAIALALECDAPTDATGLDTTAASEASDTQERARMAQERRS